MRSFILLFICLFFLLLVLLLAAIFDWMSSMVLTGPDLCSPTYHLSIRAPISGRSFWTNCWFVLWTCSWEGLPLFFCLLPFVTHFTTGGQLGTFPCTSGRKWSWKRCCTSICDHRALQQLCRVSWILVHTTATNWYWFAWCCYRTKARLIKTLS